MLYLRRKAQYQYFLRNYNLLNYLTQKKVKKLNIFCGEFNSEQFLVKVSLTAKIHFVAETLLFFKNSDGSFGKCVIEYSNRFPVMIVKLSKHNDLRRRVVLF